MDTGTAGTGTDFHTGTGHFDNFGTAPIPVPDTSVSSVRHQFQDTLVSSVRHPYRYREYRYRTEHTLVTFGVFTDYDSCTWPISINPGSMEVGEYGLTRGTCFVARRLEVVAVAVTGLLWISCCVLGGARFIFNFVDPEQSASTR